MTSTELADFLRHFAATRDWATWRAIADRFAECGDVIGERVALEVIRWKYCPVMRFEEINYDFYGSPGDTKNIASLCTGYYWRGISYLMNESFTYHTVEDAYVALINALRFRHENDPASPQ